MRPLAIVPAGAALLFGLAIRCHAATSPKGLDDLHRRIDERAASVEPEVVRMRRDFHQHPELGNRETRTAGIVAERLRALGMTVRTGVALTGVVGVLRGGKARDGSPVVALRADMDGLPVREETGLPFASRETAEYNGQTVGVMHACGHDMHVAMLLGAAEVLASVRADLPGTVVFVFQPAEEGLPAGERGGALLMVEEGALDDPKVDAIFGIHVYPDPLGEIRVREGGIKAAADNLEITVRGRQTHGAMPWSGVDPIVAASQIVLGLQTIVSRQEPITKSPLVISIGSIHGGNRANIIPDAVTMVGTIRTFDAGMREDAHRRIRETAESIARSAGATAEVKIDSQAPVLRNDPALTRRMTPSLERVAAGGKVVTVEPRTVAEDFGYFVAKVPGVYFLLGAAPAGSDAAALAALPANHSPRFSPDEGALTTGVRALASVAVDYLAAGR
jgi:amidohydrolase